MRLCVLIVEPDMHEAMMLHEALGEAAERRSFGDWVELRTVYAADLEGVPEHLAEARPDVMLVNPAMPGTATALENVVALLDLAPEIPLIAILEPENGALGPKMIREGVEDFLFRCDLDCAPLAHAICAAIERHRWTAPARWMTSVASGGGSANGYGNVIRPA